jgi:prevent-host-death family protein
MATPHNAYSARGKHGSGQSLARAGVRELRQNLSVYLRRVEAGETLEVTEHGRPVARLTPLPPQRMSVLDRLVSEGRVIPGRGGNLADLGPPPDIGPGPTLSDVLAALRDEDNR